MYRGLRRGFRPILLLTMMGFSTGNAAYCGDASLIVEARVGHGTVRNNEEFLVSTVVRNIGETVQLLRVWSCSYPQQWTTDNASVQVKQVSCRKNYLSQVKLEPGKTYERLLSLSANVGAAQKVITFRLGLDSEASAVAGSASRVWSNGLTVKIAD